MCRDVDGWEVTVKKALQIYGLAGWLAASFVAAAVGGLFRPGQWYFHLQKPAWTPPGWIFPPVWTVLYIAMAVAAWLVWRKDGFRVAPAALGLYIVQLVFNGGWSWLFFGLHSPILGLVDILLLWITLLATTVAFWRRHRAAGALLMPYLLWVTFAAALNIAVWRLNA
jgi:tryptophan-rich sensory protein